MASDPDACIPETLKDFVFDLHDSFRTSQIPEEQSTLYNGTFRELTSKYFAQGPWPSPESIASNCNNDALFLALYKELTHRHLHSITRPQVQDRIDGWHVYRSLFDLLLAESPSSSPPDEETQKTKGAFYILPDWAFDILHEFVYQFQGFCQFRTSTFANAAKYASSSSDKSPPNHIVEALETLENHRDVWAVETVLFYLHRLLAISTTITTAGKNNCTAFQYLGIFASITLSRLECLLGDYRASLLALAPISPGVTIVSEDGTTKSGEEVVMGVFSARLSVAYHAGVSYLMLRRYKDAASALGEICSVMQRKFKTGQLRKLPGSDQFNKLYDRMIALLAILTHVCPTAVVEDSVTRAIREKHGNQLSKIEAGEEGYEDLFIFACPKFVSPAVPDYTQSMTTTPSSPVGPSSFAQDAYKLQVRQFLNEMESQQTLRKLRSYMKLYTSISVGKLAAFNDMQEEEFLPLLLCYKHRMRQMERSGEAPLSGKIGNALDIHYYINDDMVHVDEAEKQRRFENYFMTQISQNEEIFKELEAISTDL